MKTDPTTPAPVRKIVGDLSNTERVPIGMNLLRRK